MTKTYSEQRQRVLFKAARDFRAIACSVLDDVRTELELQGDTARWAITLAVRTARRANALENEGHEQCVATNLSEMLQSKSRDAYSTSLHRFHERLAFARGVSQRDAEELTLGWLDSDNA